MLKKSLTFSRLVANHIKKSNAWGYLKEYRFPLKKVNIHIPPYLERVTLFFLKKKKLLQTDNFTHSSNPLTDRNKIEK